MCGKQLVLQYTVRLIVYFKIMCTKVESNFINENKHFL